MAKEQKMSMGLTIAAAVAAVWSAWQLVPAIAAMVVAFVLAFFYGIKAFNLPTWAWGLSFGAALFTLILIYLSGPDYRKKLRQNVIFMLKISGVFVFTVGAMLVLSNTMSLNEPLPDETSKQVVAINAALDAGQDTLITFVSWLVVVVPIIFAFVSIRTLLKLREPTRPTINSGCS